MAASNSGNGYQVGTTAAASTARKVLAAIAQYVGFQPFVTAFLTTAVGANANITYTARQRGTAGNAITVAYVVAGASTPLSVSVTGNAITVNVATSSGSAATSKGAQVLAAVQASAPAMALVSAVLATGNDGTGVVSAMTATALSTGVSDTIGLTGNAPLPTQPPIHYTYG
jgi:phage tail sheath gpL-like